MVHPPARIREFDALSDAVDDGTVLNPPCVIR
jgi:hypothetical protein